VEVALNERSEEILRAIKTVAEGFGDYDDCIDFVKKWIDVAIADTEPGDDAISAMRDEVDNIVDLDDDDDFDDDFDDEDEDQD
jgi:hypothetical protein